MVINKTLALILIGSAVSYEDATTRDPVFTVSGTPDCALYYYPILDVIILPATHQPGSPSGRKLTPENLALCKKYFIVCVHMSARFLL